MQVEDLNNKSLKGPQSMVVCELDMTLSKLPLELSIWPVCHDSVQNLKTSEGTLGHVLTRLTRLIPWDFWSPV